MNFQHLFTTARVIRATYQIISTTLLIYYLARGRKRRQISNENWD
jgi:hypothetical protein